MSTERIKQIIGITCCTATGDDIGEIKKKNMLGSCYVYDILPKYVLDTNGKTKITEDYLMFIEDGEENYIMFNVIYSDTLIHNMIDGCGLEYLFDKYNLTEIFKKFQLNNFNDYRLSLPNTEHIVVECIFSSSFNGEYTEYDAVMELFGYLDKELQLIKL
jgi:hypothetical protein